MHGIDGRPGALVGASGSEMARGGTGATPHTDEVGVCVLLPAIKGPAAMVFIPAGTQINEGQARPCDASPFLFFFRSTKDQKKKGDRRQSMEGGSS